MVGILGYRLVLLYLNLHETLDPKSGSCARMENSLPTELSVNKFSLVGLSELGLFP